MYNITDLMDTGKTTEGGFQILRVVNGSFTGIEFHYTKVELKEIDGEMHLQFEYLIDMGYLDKAAVKPFEQFLGEALENLIAAQIARNETVYAGGTD